MGWEGRRGLPIIGYVFQIEEIQMEIEVFKAPTFDLFHSLILYPSQFHQRGMDAMDLVSF